MRAPRGSPARHAPEKPLGWRPPNKPTALGMDSASPQISLPPTHRPSKRSDTPKSTPRGATRAGRVIIRPSIRGTIVHGRISPDALAGRGSAGYCRPAPSANTLPRDEFRAVSVRPDGHESTKAGLPTAVGFPKRHEPLAS